MGDINTLVRLSLENNEFVVNDEEKTGPVTKTINAILKPQTTTKKVIHKVKPYLAKI